MRNWLGEWRRRRNDAWRRRHGSCDHDGSWHTCVRDCPKTVLLVVALVAASCAPSGGDHVAAVRGSAASTPAATGDPLPVTDALGDLRVTTTSARPNPPPRASRSKTTVRPRAAVLQPAPRPAVVSTGSGTATNEQLDALAGCESGRDPRKNTGNGFYGAFQFMLKTWHGMGMAGNPIDYSYEAQRDVVRRIPLSAWPRQFPGCSRKLGYR